MDTIHYATFDLYDTTVVRREVSEEFVFESVWHELSKRGISLPSLEQYVQHRSDATRASQPIDAPSLQAILKHLPKSYLAHADVIESVESEIEMQQLSVVPSAIAFISTLRQKGTRIAFLSDMHISAIYLQEKIASLGLFEEGDVLLVSSDVGFSKARDGNLFRYFLDKFPIVPSNVTHFGNSFWSDVKMAKKHNIHAKYIPDLNPNKYEALIGDVALDNKARDSLINASKLTRLHSYDADDVCLFSDAHVDKKIVANVASSVAGPVLYFFVHWVLKRCREKSISTVRFLTRDGEIFKAIVDELPAKLTDGFDIQLLEVSRNSLVLPTASVVSIDSWVQAGIEPGSFLVQHFDKLPAQHLFNRAGLCIHHNEALLLEFGLAESDKPLGAAGLEKWKQALASPKVQEVILASSRSRLESVSGYLQQNIGTSNSGDVALVDVGWTGQQAAMLSALIQHATQRASLNLLVGRLRTLPLLSEASIEGWLFDESNNRPSPVQNPVALFESFLATTSGGVESYGQNGSGSWVAKRRVQQHTQALENWGQPTVKLCVTEYAKLYETTLSADEQLVMANTLLKAFWCKPAAGEAKYWGSFPYEQDQSGENIIELARKYSFQSLLYRLFGKKQEVDWKAGSLKISNPAIRLFAKVYDSLKDRIKAR